MLRKILSQILIALSLCAISNVALAAAMPLEEEAPPPTLDGWYIAGYGGWGSTPDFKFTDSSGQRNTERFKTGYDAGARFGFKSGPIRYEGEFIYMQSSVDTFTTSDTLDVTVPASGKMKLYGGLINVIYDFEGGPIECLTPYIGSGFGYAYVDNIVNTPSFNQHLKSKRDLWVGQGMVGFTFRFVQHFGVFAEYRYFFTKRPRATVKLIGGDPATGKDLLQNHTVNLGATIYLG